MLVMTAEPLRLSFRRQVREQALQVAQTLTLDKGWARVRLSEVAAAIGVSRPTLYKEFGDKNGLGEALVLQQTDQFLLGVAAVLDEHAGDARAAIAAAVDFTLAEAEASPLLHAILTAARAGDDELLPLLTSRSQPVLAAATLALVTWFDEHFPELPAEDVADGADTLVRLVVSHLVLPSEDRAATARRLARIALRCLDLDED
jgi:AcrR family transcriptional regulator